jgi:hypothetical protein
LTLPMGPLQKLNTALYIVVQPDPWGFAPADTLRRRKRGAAIPAPSGAPVARLSGPFHNYGGRTEGVEAPAQQGARRENTGSM